MKNFFLRFSFAIVGLSLFCLSINGQNREDVYAITNANIVTVSGNPIAGGTIIIRDGLIESVGTNVTVPADAKVFDGTGLTVYPGIIDAYTDIGIPKPNPQPTGGQTQTQTSGSSSNYPEGLQPEEKAFDKLKVSESQLETQRNNGITTALTVGTAGIFNGQSAIINLAGNSVPSMVIRPMFAQHVTFTTLRGGQYPTSLMGTFSVLRQMFLDARRFRDWKKMYSENPRGIRRPEADMSLEALIPVINGQVPIAFNANTEREIVRTLDLIKEFNLKGIIVGGQEAWKVSGRLKEQNVSVLLSLDFPKRTVSENKEADPENLEILRLRAEVPKNAARLKQAGVKFAFQSGAMKNIKNFLANAKEATENGLSKNDAIRAMTLGAAEILGVDDQLGSIEKGKIANLVVTRGDIFDEKKEFTHIFVDGRLFEQKPKPKKDDKKSTDEDNGKLAQVGGKWNVSIEIPGQPINGVFDFIQQGDNLTGTLTTPFGTSEIIDGKITAEGFSFSATVDAGGQEMEIFVSGILAGNEIEGTINSPQGPVTFSGTKIP